MTALLERLRNDFARNRAKTGALGALTLLLVVFGVRAVLPSAPQPAAATPAPDSGAGATPTGELRAQDLEDRIRKSQQLWTVLQTKRGLDVASAFTFDPAYFTLDPNRRIAPEPDARPEPTAQRGEMTEAEIERLRLAKVQQELRRIQLQAVMLGEKPTALINSELKHVGDRVLGFTIKSIQERQVVVVKDGVTLPVDMTR